VSSPSRDHRRSRAVSTPSVGAAALCALLLLAQICLAGSARAEANLDHALTAFGAGRYEQAHAELTELTRRDPDSAEAHFYLGLTASRLDRPDESLASYKRAAAIDPDLPSLQTSLGISLYQAREMDEAASHLERATEQDPADASAHLFLGLVHQEQGRWTESIDDFEACLSADPDLASVAWFNIGRSQIALGDREEARAALEMALQLDSEGEMRETTLTMLGSLSESETRSQPWWLNAGMGFEYDDELTVPEVDFVSNVADTAGVFDFSIGSVFPEWKGIEFEAGYDFYQSVYSDVKELNLQTHSPHLSASWSLWGITPTVGYYYIHSSLGGDAFLDLHRARLGASRLLVPWWYASLSWDIEGRIFADQDARDGVRNALVLENLFFLFERRFTGVLNWRLEGQDTNAPEFEFLGNVLRAEIRGPIRVRSYEARFEIGYEFLDRNYENITPSIGEKREDRRHAFRMRLRAPIVRHVDGVFDYTHIESHSNLPSQEYDENIVTLRAEVAF